MERLLRRLGNPEAAVPPVVHIAGTNGKGSVLAFIEAMLRAAGHRVNAYISPHLVRFNERIRLGGEPIEEDRLAAALAECERCNAGAPITFFEITTAAAFLAFRRAPAEALLLEVGLGGRLDATNVIARPALTAITPVSIDHTQYLGESLSAIAGEKAGILKPGVTAVIGRQPPEAAAAIAARAEAVSAPLLRHGFEWQAGLEGDRLAFSDPGATLALPLPALVGPHQIDNAAMAAACARALPGFALSEAAIGQGVAHAVWPGRLQRLRHGPLLAGLPPDWQIWLDGGHNAAAGQALAKVAAAWHESPLHLVLGMLNTKPPVDFLGPLAVHVASLSALEIPAQPASFTADDICVAARGLGLVARPSASVAAAVQDIVAAHGPTPGRILVCGSLYLIGSVLTEHR